LRYFDPSIGELNSEKARADFVARWAQLRTQQLILCPRRRLERLLEILFDTYIDSKSDLDVSLAYQFVGEIKEL
jgi:hypothetical protein